MGDGIGLGIQQDLQIIVFLASKLRDIGHTNLAVMPVEKYLAAVVHHSHAALRGHGGAFFNHFIEADEIHDRSIGNIRFLLNKCQIGSVFRIKAHRDIHHVHRSLGRWKDVIRLSVGGADDPFSCVGHHRHNLGALRQQVFPEAIKKVLCVPGLPPGFLCLQEAPALGHILKVVAVPVKAVGNAVVHSLRHVQKLQILLLELILAEPPEGIGRQKNAGKDQYCHQNHGAPKQHLSPLL